MRDALMVAPTHVRRLAPRTSQFKSAIESQPLMSPSARAKPNLDSHLTITIAPTCA